jgi:HKD family nuclease
MIVPATAPKPVESKWATLLGLGNALIVGLPSGFSLNRALFAAREICLATAFARLSGWECFREPVSKGTASVFLLTGLDCWHTEPKLLKEWHELTMRLPDRVEAKVAPEDLFFHPKVLIVMSDDKQADFAVVGSGNLSQGGLRDNVECGVYIEDRNFIAQLTAWFDKQFERAKRLTDEGIAAYAHSYKLNSKARTKLEEKEHRLRKQMEKYAEAKMAEWDRAVREAKAFFAKYGSEQRHKAEGKAKELQIALRWSDDFDFDRSGLDDFFANRFLGHLREGQKPKVWKHRQRFKNALRALIADPESALAKVLERRAPFKVPGVNVNTISKVLAVRDPYSWPVFNKRVEHVLDGFGYRAARGASTTNRYLAYRNLMKKFSDSCGHKNMDAFALDAFFLDCWKRRKNTSSKRSEMETANG